MNKEQLKKVVKKMMAAGEPDAKIKRFIKSSAFKQRVDGISGADVSPTYSSERDNFAANEEYNYYEQKEKERDAIRENYPQTLGNVITFGVGSSEMVGSIYKKAKDVVGSKSVSGAMTSLKKDNEYLDRKRNQDTFKLVNKLDDGEITQEQYDLEIEKINYIYDNATGPRDHYHWLQKANNLFNTEISDETKKVRDDALNASDKEYKQKNKESFASADTNKDGDIDEQEQFYYNAREEATVFLNEGIDSYLKRDIDAEIEAESKKRLMDPTGYLETRKPLYETDATSTYIDPMYSDEEDYEEEEYEEEEPIINIDSNSISPVLTQLLIQKYAGENGVSMKDAYNTYVEAGEEDYEGEDPFASVRHLMTDTSGNSPSGDGALIDYLNDIKLNDPEFFKRFNEAYISSSSDNYARQEMSQKLGIELTEKAGFFLGEGTTTLFGDPDEVKDTEKKIREFERDQEKAEAETSEINEMLESSIETTNSLLEDLENTTEGTVTVNGKVLEDENGNEIMFPNNARIQNLLDENEKILKGKYKTQEEVDEANKKINENNAEVDNILSSYKNKVENYNTSRETSLKLSNTLRKNTEEQLSAARNWNDYKAIYEMQDQRYTTFGQFGAATTGSVLNLVSAADEIIVGGNHDILQAAGIVEGPYDPWVGRQWVDQYRDKFRNMADPGTNYYSYKTGDFNSFAFERSNRTMRMIGDMVPMLAATYLSGGSATPTLMGMTIPTVAVIGTQSIGGDLERTRLEMKNNPLVHYAGWQRYTSAIVHGATEILSERLLVGQVGRVADNLMVDDFAKEGVKSWVRSTLNLGTRGVLDAVQEGFGEGVNTYTQNLSDKWLLGKDVDLMDGVSESFIDGFLVSGAITTPMLLKNTTNHLIPNTLQNKLNDNTTELLQLEKELLDNRYKYNEDGSVKQNVKSTLSSERIAQIESRMNELVNENTDLFETQLKGSVGMTQAEKRELLNIRTQQHRLKSEANTINKETGYTKKEKKEKLDEIKYRYSKLEKQKNDILQSDKRTDEEKIADYEKYKLSVKNKIDSYRNRKDRERDVESIEFETTEAVEEYMNEQNLYEDAYIQAEVDAAKRQLQQNKDFRSSDTQTRQHSELSPERRAQLENIVRQGESILENNLKQSKEGAGQFGFIHTKQNGDLVFGINKQSSLSATGRVTTAAHEFLHSVLFKTIGGDTKIQNALGNALQEYVGDKKGVTGMETFRQRMEPYIYRGKQGEVLGVEQNYSEELITIMSESILDGSLKFNEGFFTKVGDGLRRFFQRRFPNTLGKIKFDSGRDVYNFIKDYNDSIEKNYTNKAIEDVMVRGADGKLIPGVDPLLKQKSGYTYSRANQLDMMLNKYGDKISLVQNAIAQNENGDLVEDLQQSELGQGMGGIIESITKRLYDGIPKSEVNKIDLTRKDYKDALLTEAVEMITKEYDPAKQKLDKFVSSRLNLRANDLAQRLGVPQEFTTELGAAKDVTTAEDKVQQETIDTKKLEDRLTKVDPELKKELAVIKNNIIKQIEANPNLYKDKNYKSLKNLVSNEVQRMFGIAPKVGNLTKGDVRNAQMFINKHADALVAMLPQGFTSDQTSTGVQNVLLKEFYNKRSVRAKTGPGLQVQVKKPNLNVNDFTSVFGITERGKPNLYKKESNTSARIKALVEQTGKTITNQTIREHLQETNQPVDLIARLGDGKSKFMFSKGKALNEMLQKDGAKAAGVIESLFDLTNNDIHYYGGNMTALANNQLAGLLPQNEINKIAKDLQSLYDLTVPSYLESSNLFTSPTPLGSFVIDKYLQLNIEGREGYASLLSLTGENFVALKGNKTAQESARASIKSLATELDRIHGKGFALRTLYRTISAPSKIQDGEFIPVEPGGNKLKKNPNWNPRKKDGKPQDNRLGLATNAVDAALLLGAELDANGKPIGLPESPKGTSDYMKGSLNRIPEASKRPGFIERQQQNNQDIRKVMDVVRDLYQNKFINGNQVVSLMANFNANQEGITRASAILDFIPVDDINYSNNKLRLEHMTPALTTNLYALKYIFADKTTSEAARKDYNDIMDNYRLAYLPDVYDKMVNKFYKSTMPFYWTPDASALLRYYNAEMAGTFDLQMEQLSTGIIVGPELATDKKLIKQVEKGKLNAISKLLNTTLTQAALDKAGIDLNEGARTAGKVFMNSRAINESTPSRGMSAFDFDETLIDKGDNTIIATKGDDVVTITSGQWPLQGPKYAELGYEFDFSDFINVRGGVEGPLMQKFRNRIQKYGIENNYILTARPAEAAPAIKAWLKTQGIDMPIENITGLGNSTGEAKAMWIANKFAEGYNDIYFVDDALPNVEAVADMIDQLDIKGKSVQAKFKFSRQLNPEINKIIESTRQQSLDLNRIIEQTKGVKAEARYSDAQARIRGSQKDRFSMFKFFVPPSAEDFKGLLYRLLSPGKLGEQQMAFFKKALFDPFAKGYTSLNKAKQNLDAGYRNILKVFPSVKKSLSQTVEDTNFTNDQAVRVYLWDKNNVEVPGLSKRDQQTLVNHVKSNTDLLSFAQSLEGLVNLDTGYLIPNEYWLVESTSSDIQTINAELSRADHLSEFVNNRKEMFGEWKGQSLDGDIMNKLQAIYGNNYRDALEDILWRMEFGTKREKGTNKLVNKFNNWANQSVGAIMFFNMRSALLQTISSVNFINWSDNNPLKAAAAFANQKQFWKDFGMIFNSDMLKQRRAGNQRGINEAELAQAIAGSKNKAKAALNWLLTKGFLPTQIADSFAIASGGATFYRNRVKSYLKQGLTQQQAESQAFQDFQEVTEESQQSSRPDLISQQQASPLGRYILAFKNTPMQYARLMKKAVLDLANNRGDFKTNVSKIIYYGMVQNLIFNGLQAALGALIGDDDEDKDTETNKRIINGMIDSVLGGLGFGGNVIMTVKNSLLEYLKQRERGWNADHTYTILKIIGLSPTIGSKLRKIYSGIQTEKFNSEVINEMSYFDIDNPVYEAIANVISGGTNIPLDRLVKKVNNVDAALTEEISTIERLALLMGWNTWDLGIEDQDIIAVEEEIKERKDKERKEKNEKKKIEKKQQQQKENEVKEKENKEKDDGRCIAITSSGSRCKREAISDGYCTVHAKVEQGTKEVQCSKIKSNGERCKMKTMAKSGLCFYHD
tara:strand:+ start:402 stop:9788 length:9387 start_codon:yes stop_codon:yes gene_type:complete